MILVIDNYDSFTFNLVHYLMELGAEVQVVRNDALAQRRLQRRRDFISQGTAPTKRAVASSGRGLRDAARPSWEVA